jgi:anaerobic glycerol-3-phosphate dehydrogenase
VSSGPDVVVVGSGVAGLAAALAAKRAGAAVWIVEGPAGASALAGGAWDVATDRRDRAPLRASPRSLEMALDDVARERPAHPWARLGRPDSAAAIREAHEAVLGALGMYRPLARAADAEIVCTDLGLVRRAGLAQRPVLDLARVPGARIAVAWMRALRSFDGSFVARSLNELAVRAGDRRRFVAVEVEMLRRAGDAVLLPHEAALLLDSHDARGRAITAFGRALGGVGAEALLVPPVLGVDDDGVWPTLEAAVGIPVGEVVEPFTGAQSLRLSRGIRRALDSAGVVRRTKRALRVRAEDGGWRAELEDRETLRPGAIVLATGKHLGGGIAVERGEPRETLARLPVCSGGAPLAVASSARGRDPAVLFGSDPSEPGPGFALGVGWDASMRPLDAHGRAASGRLFACGSLLEGVAVDDGTGLGVAATTGWIAGRNAAARAGR